MPLDYQKVQYVCAHYHFWFSNDIALIALCQERICAKKMKKIASLGMFFTISFKTKKPVRFTKFGLVENG